MNKHRIVGRIETKPRHKTKKLCVFLAGFVLSRKIEKVIQRTTRLFLVYCGSLAFPEE